MRGGSGRWVWSWDAPLRCGVEGEAGGAGWWRGGGGGDMRWFGVGVWTCGCKACSLGGRPRHLLNGLGERERERERKKEKRSFGG